MTNSHAGLSSWGHTVIVLMGITVLSACTADSQTKQAEIKAEPAIIAVTTPGVTVAKGAKFAWHPAAIHLYRDERIDSASIQYLIEQNIRVNLRDRGYLFVDNESAAGYTIAYTAALESALDDDTILRRFGLVPGKMGIDDNPLFEKGTLLIYAFAASGEVIWRSAVQTAVDLSIENEERKKRIEPIIRDMFSSFPAAN